MEYETLRQFADSWGLVYLFALFVGVILWTFRPGSRRQADECANIPFSEDDKNG